MNFSLYVIGTPNGYDQYPLDSNSAKFQEILTSCNSESQLSVLRDNQLIQYVYVRKISNNDGLCWGFGFVLVVTGVYCLNCHTLNDLFETAFYDVLLKGKLFRYQGNSFSYQVSKFADDINEIKRINSFFKSKLEYELGDLFVTIPSSFSLGNGQTSISMKESASDIDFAVKNFDVVHITNDENNDIGRTIPSPKPKRWVLWAMLAVFLFAGTSIATYMIFHRNPPVPEIDEASIQNLKTTYDEAILEFNVKCGLIVDGKDKGVGDKGYVIDALRALKTIERCERKDPMFPQLETDTVFHNRHQLYREELYKARSKIISENEKQLYDPGDNSGYITIMRERLKYIDYIIGQTNGNSVLEVPIRPPYEKDLK